jgi:putative membrane protein
MLVGAAFTYMNAGTVTLNYYFGSREMPLSVLLLAAVCVGALLGALSVFGGIARSSREKAALRRQVRRKSEEMQQQRALAAKDH